MQTAAVDPAVVDPDDDAAFEREWQAAMQVQSTRHGLARHSTAQHGTAWHGMAQHGTTRHGIPQHITAYHSIPQHTTTRACIAPRCNAQTHASTQESNVAWPSPHPMSPQHTAALRSTPQHAAVRRSAPQYAAAHRSTHLEG